MNRKVLIIGASGLVGGNCHRFFSQTNIDVLGTHFTFPTNNTFFFDTLDLERNENEKVLLLMKEFDVIIHCGALTNVDYCEENIDASYKKTVVSTLNLLSFSEKYDIKLVYISTDYVFDGSNGPYTEGEPVNPINVYGKHKLEAEQAVINSSNKNLIVRVTNVYGTEKRDKNFISRLIANNLSNNTLKLPVDQFATPINAFDIARALFLLVRDEKHGVYHLGATDYYNRYQLAKKVLSHFKHKNITLIPVKSTELGQQANRPLMGGLLSKKFLMEYPLFDFSNIDNYLNNI